MSTFDLKDAFDVVLDRLESTYNELLKARHARDDAINEACRLRCALQDATSRIKNLSAENSQLRMSATFPEAATAPEEPASLPARPDPMPQTARFRGRAARQAGLSHRVPPDLRSDPVAAQEYVEGWAERDRANEARAPELVVADEEIPF